MRDAWTEEAREAALAARRAAGKKGTEEKSKGLFSKKAKPTKEQRSVFKKSFLKHMKELRSHGKSGGGKGLSPVSKLLGYGTSSYGEGLLSRADSRCQDVTSRFQIIE